MPPVKLTTGDLWKRSFRRCLINGPPLSGKTTSLLTFPAPRYVIVAPGELGGSSVQPAADTHIYIWEFEPGKVVSWGTVLGELDRLIAQVLQDAKDIQTFSLDGLHRLYEVIMLAEGHTADTDPKAYATYHDLFTQRMSKLLGSSIPYIACTCYDGTEPVEGVKGATQVWPDFPGKMAKRVLGMFPVVFYQQRTPGKPADRFTWQLRPTSKVQGVGVHVPPAVLRRFPDDIPIVVAADGTIGGGWQTVEKVLGEVNG